MPENGPDQIEAFSMRHRGRSKTMAQIMNSHIRNPCLQPNSLPRLLDAGEVGAAACSGEYKLAGPAVLLRNLAQNVQRRLGQGDGFGAGLAVGQAGKTCFPMDPTPLKAQDLTEAGARVDQEPQDVYGAPVLGAPRDTLGVGEGPSQGNHFFRGQKALADALPKPLNTPARINAGGQGAPFGPDREDMGQERQAAVGV